MKNSLLCTIVPLGLLLGSPLRAFISPDPEGHVASMDLYSYCNGDPVNGYDPDGRFGVGAITGKSYNTASTLGNFFGGSTPLGDIRVLSPAGEGLNNALSWAESQAGLPQGSVTAASFMFGPELGLPITGLRSLGAVAKSVELGKSANNGGRLVHMSEAAGEINTSGRLGLPGNNYAGPAANAGRSGWSLTSRTGLSPSGTYEAVPIPAAGEAGFSKVVPIGPLTTWQRLTGQQYTARGVMDLRTGAFSRTGVNWNQVGIYGTDAAITGGAIGGGIYLWNESQK